MHNVLRAVLGLSVALASLYGCGSDHRQLAVPEQSRTVAAVCSEDPPGPGSCPLAKGQNGSECGTDADCIGGVHGRCNESDGPAVCECSYDECADDASCGSGEACACRGTAGWGGANACLKGNCLTNGDCGTGYCSLSRGYNVGYYCHTVKDTCRNNSDCSQMANCFGTPVCGYTSDSESWTCICIPEPV